MEQDNNKQVFKLSKAKTRIVYGRKLNKLLPVEAISENRPITLEHVAPNPVTFTSKSQIRAYEKSHKLETQVLHG